MILPKRCRPNNIILMELRPRAVAVRCRASFFLLSGADDPREGSIRWNAAAEIISTDRPGKKGRERSNAYAVKRERERGDSARKKFFRGRRRKKETREMGEEEAVESSGKRADIFAPRSTGRTNERTNRRTDGRSGKKTK